MLIQCGAQWISYEQLLRGFSPSGRWTEKAGLYEQLSLAARILSAHPGTLERNDLGSRNDLWVQPMDGVPTRLVTHITLSADR